MSRPTKPMKTIKNKMLRYTLVLIAFMASVSIYALSVINTYQMQIDEMFQRSVALSEIRDLAEQADDALVSYLSTKSSTGLNQFTLYREELYSAFADLKGQIVGYSEEALMMRDILALGDNYLVEANRAIEEKLKNDVVAYTARYHNGLRIKRYMLAYMTELNNRQLDRNALNYLAMAQQIEQTRSINIFLMLNLFFLSIIIIYSMTSKMINPIIHLAHTAEDIAKGHYDTEPILVHTDDEIEVLAVSFDRMKNAIKDHIETLELKAETEAKLMDQQVENLKMQNLLNHAKLYALQSQINPHFLFNTINAGVQMAMLEGAEQTSAFLESMSRLFRYSIRHMDDSVSLEQEIDNIKDYYELLKVRFGDFIEFKFQIDAGLQSLKMPPLILQPIVENAYLHGLSKQEGGGRITITAKSVDFGVSIVVKDTGVGMTEAQIKAIMTGHKDKDLNDGHTHVGLKNVLERLELFYHECHEVYISSQKGIGTTVAIKINQGEVHDD